MRRPRVFLGSPPSITLGARLPDSESVCTPGAPAARDCGDLASTLHSASLSVCPPGWQGLERQAMCLEESLAGRFTLIHYEEHPWCRRWGLSAWPQLLLLVVLGCLTQHRGSRQELQWFWEAAKSFASSHLWICLIWREQNPNVWLVSLNRRNTYVRLYHFRLEQKHTWELNKIYREITEGHFDPTHRY